MLVEQTCPECSCVPGAKGRKTNKNTPERVLRVKDGLALNFREQPACSVWEGNVLMCVHTF